MALNWKRIWKRNWKRKLLYAYSKIVRADGTPEYIARGWAIGMFIGMFIPMSFQLTISIPLSFLMRGSKIGATLGTLVTNPLTVIFIYPFQCWLGNRLIGGDLSWNAIKDAIKGLLTEADFASFAALGWDIILSFFAGGLLFAVIATPLTYIAVYHLVLRYRRLKAALKAKRAEKKQ